MRRVRPHTHVGTAALWWSDIGGWAQLPHRSRRSHLLRSDRSLRREDLLHLRKPPALPTLPYDCSPLSNGGDAPHETHNAVGVTMPQPARLALTRRKRTRGRSQGEL